ncbi:MAG TPA: HAD hydrolase family protein [Syntrophales bacterium]|nr:HAD hydrolase family protein [Syntrophales bacterium]
MVYKIVDKVLNEKIKAISLLVLDVDGVMTDGKIIIDDMGREIKNFDVKDGHGLKILMRYGIDVVLLTGRRSAVVEHRARDLGIREVHQGILNKLEIFEEILRKRSLGYGNIAFIGDDIVDIPLLKRVGFSVAVADASKDVKKCVDYVTKKTGGDGAVREVCELILQAQEKWVDVAKRYEFF